MITRKEISDILEPAEGSSRLSLCYDIFMMLVVAVSIIPLTLMDPDPVFDQIENVITCIFILDYLLRWFTADITLKMGRKSFWRYIFTKMAVIDLITILPTVLSWLSCVSFLNPSVRMLRFVRITRVLRVMKFVRYFSFFSIFYEILKKEADVLISVLLIASAYIFVTALILFNVEPHINPYTGEQTFSSFFDALYWATVTLTTVGYGDLCPITDLGRAVSMLSSLFGVAIIALPSGVITARYLDELRESRRKRPKERGK